MKSLPVAELALAEAILLVHCLQFNSPDYVPKTFLKILADSRGQALCSSSTRFSTSSTASHFAKPYYRQHAQVSQVAWLYPAPVHNSTVFSRIGSERSYSESTMIEHCILNKKVHMVKITFFQTARAGANYEEPKIKAIDIAALLQEKYAFLSGE